MEDNTDVDGNPFDVASRSVHTLRAPVTQLSLKQTNRPHNGKRRGEEQEIRTEHGWRRVGNKGGTNT
jgi:hypothetical protein